jgi:tetratricopeptide (TPR) repeat protein
LEAFEPATIPAGAEVLRFGSLGERAYARDLIRKRPTLLFSEFLDQNPAGVAQGMAAAMLGRRLVLVGEGPRAAFRSYGLRPRILCEVLESSPKPSPDPDPAGALEDLDLVRGGPAALWAAEGFVRLGYHFLTKKQASQAFTSASRALDLDPNSAPARALRQEVYEGSGKLDQARQGYEEILRRTPGDIQAHLDLARVLIKKGASDEAALHFQEVLGLNRREAEALLGLGLIQAAKGEKRQAVDSLEKGLRLQSEDDEARLVLARLYLSLDNPRAAEEHLRYLLEKKPEDPKIQELLGKSLAAKDRP